MWRERGVGFTPPSVISVRHAGLASHAPLRRAALTIKLRVR
jgi:hypothetical protein